MDAPSEETLGEAGELSADLGDTSGGRHGNLLGKGGEKGLLGRAA
jgi:hypothetical protein